MGIIAKICLQWSEDLLVMPVKCLTSTQKQQYPYQHPETQERWCTTIKEVCSVSAWSKHEKQLQITKRHIRNKTFYVY